MSLLKRQCAIAEDFLFDHKDAGETKAGQYRDDVMGGNNLLDELFINGFTHGFYLGTYM